MFIFKHFKQSLNKDQASPLNFFLLKQSMYVNALLACSVP